MKLNNASHWFAAILATFVLCIGLQGCSNINTASLASNQISFEQNAALLSEQTTALAASQGLLKGSALAAVVGYEAVANTAIANAKAAYESGDVNTANHRSLSSPLCSCSESLPPISR